MKEITWTRRDVEVAYRLGKISSDTYHRFVQELEALDNERRRIARSRWALAIAQLRNNRGKASREVAG